MDARLIALKLSLDELGVDFDISTIEKRKIIQKVIYLGQFAGADLGYRFTWYQMGPYSGDLARDYSSLANALSVGDEDYKSRELQETKKSALDLISPLLKVPENSQLDQSWLELIASLHSLKSENSQSELEQSLWLELIASLHYLKKVVGLSENKVKAEIKQQKKHLFPFVDLAITQLKYYKSLQF